MEGKVLGAGRSVLAARGPAQWSRRAGGRVGVLSMNVCVRGPPLWPFLVCASSSFLECLVQLQENRQICARLAIAVTSRASLARPASLARCCRASPPAPPVGFMRCIPPGGGAGPISQYLIYIRFTDVSDSNQHCSHTTDFLNMNINTMSSECEVVPAALEEEATG